MTPRNNVRSDLCVERAAAGLLWQRPKDGILTYNPPMGNFPPQPPDESALSRPDPYLRIQSVTVYVRDLDQSLRFYVDQLGFDLVFDARKEPRRRWVAVAPPDGTAMLTLAQPASDSEEYKLIGRLTQVALVTENITAKFREWSQRGVNFQSVPRLRRLRHEARVVARRSAANPTTSCEESKTIWGGAFARFNDPDGNSFLLVSFDELSRELETQRRAAAEKLESERRAAQELEIAKQVQARLFPQTLPPLRTLDYTGVCIQAREVGGDYYDFLGCSSGRLGLVIGDIAGKGIAGALLMANLQAILRSQIALAVDQPERFLSLVNQLFYDNTADSAYASLIFAEYDDKVRRLRYANCGHLSALLLRSDGTVEPLESTATVLGLFKEWVCSVEERQLSPGDLLALYTDGITEALNDRGEEFGERRLTEALREHRALSPQDLLMAVVREVRRFSLHEQHDDITLIVARCKAN